MSCQNKSPCCTLGCCIEEINQDVRFFFLFRIYNNIIRKAEISMMLTLHSCSSNASHIVIPLSDSKCSSRAAIEQNCTLGLVIHIFDDSYNVWFDVVFIIRCCHCWCGLGISLVQQFPFLSILQVCVEGPSPVQLSSSTNGLPFSPAWFL